MSRMVKFGLAAAVALIVTVTATDVFAQCCNDDCGRVGFRGRRAARRNCYTNTCCTQQTSCCATPAPACGCAQAAAPACGCAQAAPACGCAQTACNSCQNGCGCAVANHCGSGCCNKGCDNGCCSRGLAGRRAARRSSYVSTGCCDSGCNTGCCGSTGGCSSCAQGVIQGSSEGSIVVPEASGQPVEPAKTVPSDT